MTVYSAMCGSLKEAVELYAIQCGCEVCLPLRAQDLMPQERIRQFCQNNKCGHYRRNHMCPPHVGTLPSIKNRLAEYRAGFLLRKTWSVDVRNDRVALKRAQLEFHHLILDVEKYIAKRVQAEVWGFVGGHCSLCEVCELNAGRPCCDPGRARTSLEAIGVDVQHLLKQCGLDGGFHTDRVTWTGCLLY